MGDPPTSKTFDFFSEHGKRRIQKSTLRCLGFHENYRRWPENLTQKIICFSEHGKHERHENTPCGDGVGESKLSKEQ